MLVTESRGYKGSRVYRVKPAHKVCKAKQDRLARRVHRVLKENRAAGRARTCRG